MLIYILLFTFNLITIPIYLVKSKAYLIINLIPLWILMSFRDVSVGADTISYYNIFYQSEINRIPMSFVNWLAPIHDARFENGFLLLNKLVYAISPNFRLLLIVTVSIMLSCLAFFIVELNINYIIGILTYESMLMPFYMNAMRQALAISLCMVAFVFLIKDKIGLFLVFNYLAITMHVTAWVFLITLVYKYIKKEWKGNAILIACILIVSLFFEKIYNNIASISDEANSFSNTVAHNSLNGSLNIAYSTILIIVVVVWLRHYSGKLNEIRDYSVINSARLLLLTAAAFYLLALNFSQISRIAMFFIIGYLPVLSFLGGGFNVQRKRNIAFAGICTYLIISFIVIQTIRPEWSGITPYVFL